MNFLKEISTPCHSSIIAHAIALAVCLLFGSYALALPRPDVGRDVSPSSVETEADLDGDGRLDIVSESCEADCEIEVALSGQRRSLHLGTKALLRGLVAADIDRDGDLDLVMLGRDGTLAVWTNDGRGHGRFASEPRAPCAPVPPSHDPATSAGHLELTLSEQPRPSLTCTARPSISGSTIVTMAPAIQADVPSAPSVFVRPDRGPPLQSPPLTL